MEGALHHHQQQQPSSDPKMSNLYFMQADSSYNLGATAIDSQISDVWLNEVLEVSDMSPGSPSAMLSGSQQQGNMNGNRFAPSPLLPGIPESQAPGTDFNDILASIKEIRKETVDSSIPSSTVDSDYSASIASPSFPNAQER